MILLPQHRAFARYVLHPIDHADIPVDMLEKLAQGVRKELPSEAAEVDREIALRKAAAPRAEEVRTATPAVRTAVLLMPCGHPTTDLRESGNPEGFCLGCARLEDLLSGPVDRKALVKWEQHVRGLIATPSPAANCPSVLAEDRSSPAAALPSPAAESRAP